MLKFTVKDRSPFEYLQTCRVCRNWRHKPWYVPIVNKCLNLTNRGHITWHQSRNTCSVLVLVSVTLNLYFRLFPNFYVPCVKYDSGCVITTTISSLFVYFCQSMSHNRFLWKYCIIQIWEETVANFCILPMWTLIAQNFFSILLLYSRNNTLLHSTCFSSISDIPRCILRR